MLETIINNTFYYTPAQNTVWGIILSFLMFLISYRAYKTYTKTQNRKMAIIVAGFILSGVFEMLHSVYSYTSGIQFFYMFFRNLTLSGSIFIALFLNLNSIKNSIKIFNKKVVVISITYFLGIILLRFLLGNEILENKIPYVSLEIIFAAIYFLLAVLFFDIRLNCKLKVISPMIIGLCFLSLSETYLITPMYLSSIYRLIIHIESLIGLISIFLGIKDLCLKKDPLNSRQKLLIFSSSILLSFYWLMILLGLIIFRIDFPVYFKYYIFILFIITVIIQYILSIRVVDPSSQSPRSIKSTYLITSLLIITGILLAQSLISLFIFKTYIENLVKNYLESRIENEANKFYSQVNDVELINLISANAVKNFSIKSLEPIIKSNLRLNPLILGSGVFLKPNEYRQGLKYYGPYWFKDKNGNIRFTWRYSSPEYNYFQYDWYKNGFIPGIKTVWSEPFVDIITNIPMMSVTSPIRRNKSVIGVFDTDVQIASFQNYVSKIKVGKVGYALIISNTGYYIHGEKSKKFLDDTANNKNNNIKDIREKIIKANKTGILRTIIDNKDFFIAYTPIGNTKLKMVFIIPASEVFSNINTRLLSNIILYFLSVILFLIIFTLLFSRTIAKPLDELVKTVDKIAKGDLSVRAPVKSSDEMALFAGSLNYMIESLENLINREKLSREIIEIIRSSMDINEIKRTFVDEIGKFFKADRVILSEYDFQKNVFLPIDPNSEYLANSDIPSLMGYDWSSPSVQTFIQSIKEQGEINIPDLDEYLKEYNLENSNLERLFNEWDIKSSYNILILYGREILGFFCLDYIREKHKLSKEDLDFLKTIANQAGIALHQTKLYETTKVQAGREALLRKITETIRSSLNIDETLDIITSEVAKIFNADRVTIVQLLEKYKKDTIRSEFLVNESIKGIKFFGEERFKIFEYIASRIFPNDEPLSYANIAESDLPVFVKEFYKKLCVNSIIFVPIKKRYDEWGMLSLSYINKYKFWNEEEKDILKSVANQVYMAIKQAELYTTTKKQAEREVLLRKIVETLRSSLDINEVLTIICDEVGRMFNVQRATIVQFPNPQNYEDYITAREYKSSPEIKGITNVEYHRKSAVYWAEKTLKEGKNLFIDNIAESDTPDYFKKSYEAIGVKSLLGFPIKKEEDNWGIIVLSEYNYYRHWTEDEINLLETISSQIYIAIKQAELYSTTKRQAERQSSLRRIIAKIGSSLDINEVKNTFVTEIGKTLNSDLNVFYEFNSENNMFLPVDEHSTYRSSPDIKSLVGVNLEKYGYGELFRKQKTEIIISNIEDFIKNLDLTGTFRERFIREFGIKSAIIVPIIYGNQFFGMFTINYIKSYRNITEDDVNFVKTLANQAGIALYQAKLYIKETQTAERERILRDIISKIRSSFDIGYIKHEMVNQIGTLFKADRVDIVDYNLETENYNVSKEAEYKSSDKIKTFLGLDFKSVPGFIKYIRNIHIKGQDIIFDNLENYLNENNFKGTDIENFYKNYGYVSSAAINIYYGDIFLGDLVITFDHQRNFSDDEIKFLRTIADQSGVAIYQGQLYSREKRTAEREALLRKVVETMRSTLDINEIKNKIVIEMGKLLDAERCFIYEFGPESKEGYVDKYSEYLASSKLRSIVNEPIRDIAPEWSYINVIEKHEFYIPDTQKYLEENNMYGTSIEKHIVDYDIKSVIGMPILYGDTIEGTLAVHFKKKYPISTEQLGLIRSIADQAGIALSQAKLYNREKQTAKREALLRKVVEAMRSSLDIDEVLTIICDEVGKLFNVERAAIIDLTDIKKYDEFTVRREYKKSPDIKGLTNSEFDKPVAIYWTKKTFEESNPIAIDNIPESDTPDYFKETYKRLGVKSIMGIPIKKGRDIWGNFVLSEYNYYRHWTEEEITLLETIADQVYIAINQAELYTTTKEYADREKTLREIITTIRSTLDINKIKNTFVTEIGTLFNADRSFITEYDFNTGLFLNIDKHSEYLRSPEVKSVIGDDLEKYKYHANHIREKQEVIIQNAEEFISQTHLKEMPYENYITKYGVKSGITLPILYRDQLLGGLSIQFTTNYHTFTDEELDFVRTLANQAGIAIYQSRLYESVRQTAEKERLLREIISEIKVFQSFDQAYNYILEKMSAIFDVDRTIFIEIPAFKYEKPVIKYEYLKNKNLSPIINAHVPASCQQMFIEMAKDLNIVTTNNVSKYFAEQKDTQKFFKDNDIKSFIASPFAKYDKEARLFGILLLCSAKEREWTSKEIELLKSITESITTVLWEISKFNEINELRNTFILTLAHDLQVPLVGEKRALEFLESRPGEQPIGKFREFIRETLQSHESLFNLLTRLLESYYYESGKKQLNLVEYNIKDVINHVVGKLGELAKSKSMKITVEIEESLPNFKLDKEEIEEALYYLVENAITYTQTGGQVIIKSYKLQDEVIACVSDNGPGIEPEIRERIFKRYEMAQAIERKIGSGLSLYLAKQIIEAHKGRIWYETESGVGSIFCFVLPMST